MTDSFTIVATAREAEALYNDEAVLRDFAHAHLDWASVDSLPELLSLVRGDGPVNVASREDHAGIARFGTLIAEFAFFGDDADRAPYCVVVPRELVERLVTLAPAEAERVLRAWGDTDALRFAGRALPDERYRAAMAYTFGHFLRLCRLARATGKQVYLYITV